jgi:uncharacterized protein (TIGR04255 family)
MTAGHPHPHLSKAPIIEALVDIRFSTKEELSLDVFEEIYSHISEQYSKKHQTKQVTITFGANDAAAPPPSENLLGFRYDSPDDGFVLQLKRTGFTLSKLAPYSDWTQLRTEAQRLWQLVTDYIGEATIVRAALRYINRIEVLGDTIDFDDYLVAGPRIPIGLPQTLSEFATRNAIIFEEKKIVAVVNQSFDHSADAPNKFFINLDIDVFRNDMSITDPSSLWELLDDIHEIKNRVFFSSVTPKLLEKLK